MRSDEDKLPTLAQAMQTFASMLCLVETVSEKVDRIAAKLDTLSPRESAPPIHKSIMLNGKEFYTVKEIADIIGTSDKTVRRLQKRGFFKSSKALRTKQIPRSEIERYKSETV